MEPPECTAVTVAIYRGRSEPVKALNWSQDGRFLFIAEAGEKLHIWKAVQPQPVSSHVFPVPVAQVRAIQALAWSSDGQFLATAGLDNAMLFWRMPEHRNWWQSLTGSLGFRSSREFHHLSPVHALSWSPDGSMIASAEESGRVHVWDARLHEELLVYQGHKEGAKDIAWSPDGLCIASTGLDHTVQVRDSVDGEKLWHWYANRQTIITALAWSPDGRYLACGANNGTVHVWDMFQERQAYVCTKHKRAVNAVAWSPDGQRIASASSDHTVQVWSALNGKAMFSYCSHEQQVLTVAWSPDGQHLASADVDTMVHIWKTV
jgi:WD40 repeat protein